MSLTIDQAVGQQIEEFNADVYRDFRKLYLRLKRKIQRKIQGLKQRRPAPWANVSVASEMLVLTAEYDSSLGKYVLVSADIVEGPEPRPPGTTSKPAHLASAVLELPTDHVERPIVIFISYKSGTIRHRRGQIAMSSTGRAATSLKSECGSGAANLGDVPRRSASHFTPPTAPVFEIERRAPFFSTANSQAELTLRSTLLFGGLTFPLSPASAPLGLFP